MKEITLTVNEEQLKIIEMGLSELPYKYSAPVVQSLGQQIQAQMQQEGGAVANG